MRTLSADLTAAQKAPSGVPYVPVVIENVVAGVRRQDFTVLASAVNSLVKHDIAVDGSKNVHRVRIDSGAVAYQRVTAPDTDPWTSWTNLATGKGSQVAIAAISARVIVIYTDAGGTNILYRESTDNGANFSAEATLTAAGGTVNDLAIAYKNSGGDFVVAWVISNVHLKLRTGGTLGSLQSSPHSFFSLNGIAATYGADYDLLVTGAEVTSERPTVWSLAYGDGGDVTAATWSALQPQAQAEKDVSTTFAAPFLMFTSGDTYRATFVEAATYTGGQSRVYRMWLHPQVSYAAGPYTWRAPLPASDQAGVGLAIAMTAVAAGGWFYESHPQLIQRAPRDVVQRDVTADVLALELTETAQSARGWIDLDNANGQYANPPAPIALGNRVDLRFGYYTASGNASSRPVDLYIAGVEHRRDGGASVLRLQLESFWDVLRRLRHRSQVIHTGDTYRIIVNTIMARAGVQVVFSSASSRSNTVTPKFIISPGASHYDALRQALAFLADRVLMTDDADCRFTEPLAGAADVYDFGTDHPIRAIVLRQEPPPVTEAHAFGNGSTSLRHTFPDVSLGLGTLSQRRDLTSTTATETGNTATAELRRRALDAERGRLIVQPNVGLEVLDAVGFTDTLVAAAEQHGRVQSIRWRYDRRRALYEQEIGLGAL